MLISLIANVNIKYTAINEISNSKRSGYFRHFFISFKLVISVDQEIDTSTCLISQFLWMNYLSS